MLDGLHTAMMASITCQNNQYVIIITNITGLYYWDPGERHSLSVSHRSQQSNFSRLDSDPRQCASLVLNNQQMHNTHKVSVYIGSRTVLAGINVFLIHCHYIAVSSAATWTYIAYYYPFSTQRQSGITSVLVQAIPAQAGVLCCWIWDNYKDSPFRVHPIGKALLFTSYGDMFQDWLW